MQNKWKDNWENKQQREGKYNDNVDDDEAGNNVVWHILNFHSETLLGVYGSKRVLVWTPNEGVGNNTGYYPLINSN